ncbi:hypothetical protein D3C76_675090 [compost metagenome]
MARPDQVQALLIQLNQGQPHQRRPGQIEAFGGILGCQCLQSVVRHLAPTPVEHAQRQAGLTLHHLQRLGPLGR